MGVIQKIFDLPIGYADHTDPNDDKNILISVLPQFSGHNVLEKHITNVYGKKRIDAQAAITIDMMKQIISFAKAAHLSVGNKAFEYSEAELNYGNTGPMKKAIVGRKKINKGEVLTIDKIAYKRTETASPILQKDIVKLLGAKVIEDIEPDEIISYNKIEYNFKKESFDQFFISKNEK